MPHCIVKNCKNVATKVKKGDGVSYFVIPKDSERNIAWRRFIAISRGDYYVPSPFAAVCSDHFKEDDMVKTPKGIRRLKTTAVPTLQMTDVKKLRDKGHFNKKPDISNQTAIIPSIEDNNKNATFMKIQIMDPSADVQYEVTIDGAEQCLSATDGPTIPSSQEAGQDSEDSNSKNNLGNIVNEVFNFETGKLSDVDKFKRRLIRSIARSLFVDKVPEDEMWAQLRKDTDCDCYMLWKRMRALTLKKLRRLLAAEDRWENITKVARLSVTDWLLFDLVLVHEKVDLIGQESMTEHSKEPAVLYELFELVNEFKVEKLQGDELIRAWVLLTLEYNKRGRQCSPMLLQRRWYQMKQLARIKFYNFWFAYGGTASKLEKAWQQKPTELQAEIAKRYRWIVINEFPSWEELMMKKKVILREDFETLSLEEPVNQKAPDVLIIETPVETIHIEEDSDADDDGKSEKQSKTLPVTDVVSKPKVEKLEICIDNIKSEAKEQESDSYGSVDVQVLEDMHIPVEQNKLQASQRNSEFESNLINAGNIQGECLDEVLPKITSVTGGVELLDSDEDCDDALITLPQQVDSIESNSDVITHSAAQPHSNISEDISRSSPVTSSMISIKQDKNADENQDYEVQFDDLIILDDGIELEDDGIELLEEDGTEDLISMNTKPIINGQEEKKIDEISKFDYKLLLTPVVYTKKLDDMDVFKFIDYNKVRDVRIIECSFIESKTVKIKKENTEVTKDISEQTHLDKENSVKPESIENAYEKNYNSSEYVNDSQRVKYSSWLLQKPKNRSYNSIQLCKNPDFNTRLKRLTAGFLSCENNRLLLNKCKKMTIDLHKSFETKLIDGKIYLQNSKFTDNTEKNDPSMQAQLDAIKVSLSNIVPIISSMNTNKTVIKREILQEDNNEVKKIADSCKKNDKLLTVEVTPMKDNNINYNPPVEIVADLSAKQLEQGQEILNQVQEPNKLQDCETSKVSIEINVNDRQLKDNENAETVDLEHGNNSINRRINKHKFQNLIGKTLINGPKNYRFGYSLNTPSRVPVAWNSGPKFYKNTNEDDMFGGILLASDTLEKMFQLLSNQTIDDKKTKKKKRKLMEMEIAKHNRAGQEVIRDKEDKNSEIVVNSEIETKVSKPTENNQNLNASSETSTIPEMDSKKKRGRPLTSTQVSHLKGSRYCCWALEKLVTNKIPKEPHYCPIPICICCCRDRLLEKSMRDKHGRTQRNNKGAVAKKEKSQTTENITKKSKPQKNIIITLSREQMDKPILDTPIVLSDDDEDDKNRTCQNVEIDTNKRCQSGAKNMISNSEEIINEGFHKTVDVPNSTSDISTSHALEISVPDMSVVEQTTLISQSKDNKINLPSKTRGRPLPKISVSSRSSLNQQVLQKNLPQNEPNKGNNQQIIELNDPSFENNSKYLQHKSPKLIEMLSSPPKLIRESGTDIYLNKSLFSESFSTDTNNPSKMPIFLGKNKILLCSNNSLSGSPIQADSIVTEEGQAVLPPGVQIVLLPSGELALSIEPGINFTPEAISKLSEILIAVQQQLNVSGEKTDIEKSLEPLNIDVGDLNTNTTITSGSDKNNLVNQAKQNKSECIPLIEVQNTTSSEVETTNLDSELLTDVLGEIKEKSSGTQSEIVNETHIDGQTLDNSADSAAQPNKKSILSDLMEMSGISENDAICDDKIQIKSHEKLSASVNSITSEAIPRKEPIKIMSSDQIMPSVDTLEQSVVYKALEKRKELSIVSSFAELKDCHEKHCQFYKMDTETGQILPINLKIKKSARFPRRRRNAQQLIDPDSVIDLTDDQVVITTEEPTKPVVSQNTTSGSNIKPINLIRSIRSIGSNPNKEIISLELLKTNSFTSDTKSTLVNILKRKKSLLISNQISDMNSAATNENNLSNDNNNETQDQDSDSDDEPLAQKAMRKRENDVSVSELHAVSPKIFDIEKNVDSEPTEFSFPEFLEQDNHEYNDEDSDENCILGV